MIAFKQLIAPFDGVVTARRTNVGDYVNAAGGDATMRNAATPLFSVADIHAMRIFVSVPQEYRRRPEAGPDRDADAAAGPGQADPGAGS